MEKQLKNSLSHIKRAYELGMSINMLNGFQLKVYDMVDALTNDQTNDNTLEMIDMIQDFDGDFSGIFDFDEFTKFIHDIRHKRLIITQECAKMLIDIFDPSKDLAKNEVIDKVYRRCVSINLLEDFKFTYEDLIDILDEDESHPVFKQILKKIKNEPKQDQVKFEDFLDLVRTGEKNQKKIQKFNNNF